MGFAYRCPVCGGLFDFTGPPRYQTVEVEEDLSGIWRFRHTFGLDEAAPVVSLGEGNTPLVWGEAFGRLVGFKLEYLNPTGSFKDRGSAVLVSFACSRGVQSALEDSSGNAGASFAAYAARAGLQARVFVPDSASGPKRAQIEAYGAELVRVMGPRSNAGEAARRAADSGGHYTSHAYLPFNLPGYATLAYELVEQLGNAPGTVLAPAGQGGLLLGIARGFSALVEAGLIGNLPVLCGVQARACAPLWAVSTYGPASLAWISEGETLAEGIRIRHPLRGDAVLQAVESSRGTFLAVDEEEILSGRDELARQGFYVEPTSAVIWPALAQLPAETPEPVVAVLTGSGFKVR
ncbi:MAG TPA: pyridoxal-phosphate dependent enzyme [Anaerolineales bacterium]